MRFRYEEYSPNNKKQYVIAVGIHELRALLSAAESAKVWCPQITVEERERRSALSRSIKGLKDALAYTESIKDDGKRRRPYQGVEK